MGGTIGHRLRAVGILAAAVVIPIGAGVAGGWAMAIGLGMLLGALACGVLEIFLVSRRPLSPSGQPVFWMMFLALGYFLFAAVARLSVTDIRFSSEPAPGDPFLLALYVPMFTLFLGGGFEYWERRREGAPIEEDPFGPWIAIAGVAVLVVTVFFVTIAGPGAGPLTRATREFLFLVGASYVALGLLMGPARRFLAEANRRDDAKIRAIRERHREH